MTHMVSDIEKRQPHRWITRAIRHLGQTDDAGTREAIATLSACQAQVQPVDISAALGKVTR